MLATLYKIDEEYFLFLGANGFHVKAKNERLTAAGSPYRQNLKYEYFTSSFDRRTCSTSIFPHSTNHIIDLWHCCCRPPSLVVELPIDKKAVGHHPGTYISNVILYFAVRAVNIVFWACKG